MMEQWTCSSLNAGKNYQKSVVLSHLATGTGISKCESDLKHEAEPPSDYALYPALDATVSPRSRPDRARRLYLWFSDPIFARLREVLVEDFLGAAKEAARIRKRLHPAKSCVMPKCTTGRLSRLEYRSLHGRSRERQCFQTFA